MVWQSLAVMTISDYWQFSQPVEADYIRVRFSNPSNTIGSGYICQANDDAIGRLVFQERFIQPKEEGQVLYMPKPACFTSRVIGVKSKVFAPVEPWIATLEYWDIVAPSPTDITLPSVIDSGLF